MRVTWRKEPHSLGLASVCEGPRGFILKVDGEDVGYVHAHRKGLSFDYSGWYWVARSDSHGVPLMNSVIEDKIYRDIEDAKRDCRAYVVSMLARAEKQS